MCECMCVCWWLVWSRLVHECACINCSHKIWFYLCSRERKWKIFSLQRRKKIFVFCLFILLRLSGKCVRGKENFCLVIFERMAIFLSQFLIVDLIATQRALQSKCHPRKCNINSYRKNNLHIMHGNKIITLLHIETTSKMLLRKFHIWNCVYVCLLSSNKWERKCPSLGIT